MLYQIIYQGIIYSKSPINTRVDVEFAEYLEFPSVVICNYNLYRKSYLEKNEKEFADFLRYVADLTATHQSFDYSTYRGNLTTRNFTNLSLNAAHQLDSILLATFDNEAISSANFSLSILEFGVCFTFNYNTIDRLRARAPGISHGLQVLLDVREWEYFYSPALGIPGSSGFQIQVFDSNTTTPRVNEYGVAVGPGTRTLIGLSLYESHNLPPTLGGKCGEKTLKYHDVYRVSSCRLECQTDFVIASCGCRAHFMPGSDRECNPPEMMCVRDAAKTFNKDAAFRCECPIPCRQVRYEATVSQTKYPSDFYSKYLADQISATRNVNLTEDNFRDSLCLINIFFTELIRHKTTQQQAYSFVSLLSDIGGSLGMWIGGSILTLVEVFDIMGYSIFKTRGR
ncbi:acid-sensing ion channel 4-A-like [Lytechinus pictus]|uniref:acid-sensing ion channel 4-A-like n=1 Tax=Lytechinus pictus TaxID=7653 RepID=UPI0030BA2699